MTRQLAAHPFELDERGFVYIKADTGQKYWVCRWEDQAWQFWWHTDRYWVTHRALTENEVERIFGTERLLSDTHAQDLHVLNDINRPKY